MRMGRLLTSTLIFAVLGTAGAAFAQEAAPAELPPASYEGRQYVDSQGCVFVRGGFGNTVRWVPRVNRDRTPVCNYKPTFGAGQKVLDIAKTAPETATPAPSRPAKTVVAAAKPVSRPAAKVEEAPASLKGYSGGRNAPMPTIALTTTPPKIGRSVARAQTVPEAGAAPVVSATNEYVSPYMVNGAPAAVTITGTEILAGASTSCPNSPAQATRYLLSDGRSVLRCAAPAADPAGFINTANVNNLTIQPGGYQSPYVAQSVAVASASVPTTGRAKVNHNVTQLPVTPQQAYAASSPYAVPREVYVKTPNAPVSVAPVAIAAPNPTGYAPAFDDGRLNPFRGPRSAAGDAQMQQLWDDSVPAKLIRYPARSSVPAQSVQVSVSSKSVAPASTRRAAPSGRFVQVGTYAMASNAEGAKARLRAQGLPVASSRTSKGLMVVYAGPFNAGALSGALNAARRAGFGDAYIR